MKEPWQLVAQAWKAAAEFTAEHGSEHCSEEDDCQYPDCLKSVALFKKAHELEADVWRRNLNMKVGDILKAKCGFCGEEHEWIVDIIGGQDGYCNAGMVSCNVVGWPDNNPCKEKVYCQWIQIL